MAALSFRQTMKVSKHSMPASLTGSEHRMLWAVFDCVCRYGGSTSRAALLIFQTGPEFWPAQHCTAQQFSVALDLAAESARNLVVLSNFMVHRDNVYRKELAMRRSAARCVASAWRPVSAWALREVSRPSSFFRAVVRALFRRCCIRPHPSSACLPRK